MKKHIVSRLLMIALLVLAGAREAAAFNIAIFTTASAAQSYCPKDKVVWLNVITSTYYLKEQHASGSNQYGNRVPGGYIYGNGISGGFVCKKNADQVGYYAAPNG